MQKQLQYVLSKASSSQSVMAQPNSTEFEIDKNLFDYITQVCDNGSINGVLLRNLIFLASVKNIHRPLELLVIVVDKNISKLETLWKNIINEKDIPFTECIRSLGLQLDSFFTHLDEIAHIFHIYNKKQLSILLHKRCYQLLPIIENVLQLFGKDNSLTANDLPGLLTIVVILHRFISLRILKVDNEFFNGFILPENEDEGRIIQHIALIENLEYLYEIWINRLLIEMSGDSLMSSFELMPYMNPEIIGDIHSRLMIERFVSQVDHSISLESSLIKRLQDGGVDSDVTWKCSKLIGDVELSQKLLTKYTKVDSKSPSIQPLITNSYLWGIANKNNQIILPKIIQNELTTYEKIAFDAENFMIQPMNDNGWALIEFDGANEKTYNVKVTISQLAILCCFSEMVILTCQAISEKTKLSNERCISILMAMMKCKMLRRKAYPSSNNNGHALDSFMINPTFEHKDLDFSITDLDIIVKENDVTYTQSQIRKVIRYELRLAPNKVLPNNDLHLRVHTRLNGIEYQHYKTALERLIDEGFITDKDINKDDKSNNEVSNEESKEEKIAGVYCSPALRDYIFPDNKNRVINSFGEFMNKFMTRISEDGVQIHGSIKRKVPANIVNILGLKSNMVKKFDIRSAVRKMVDGHKISPSNKKKVPEKAQNNSYQFIHLLSQ